MALEAGNCFTVSAAGWSVKLQIILFITGFREKMYFKALGITVSLFLLQALSGKGHTGKSNPSLIHRLPQERKGVFMSIKSFILKTGAFLFLACLFLMPSMHTQAAVKKMDILNGDSRKSCQVDLDGDGVKEKLKMAVKYDAYDCIKNVSVYVNGKKALVIKPLSFKLPSSNTYVPVHETLPILSS